LKELEKRNAAFETLQQKHDQLVAVFEKTQVDLLDAVSCEILAYFRALQQNSMVFSNISSGNFIDAILRNDEV
jgi:hypothetical protein